MFFAIMAEDLPGTLARRLEAAEDPYAAAGVHARATVKPFRKVLP